MGLQVQIQRHRLEQRERLKDEVDLHIKRKAFARNLIEIWGRAKEMKLESWQTVEVMERAKEGRW